MNAGTMRSRGRDSGFCGPTIGCWLGARMLLAALLVIAGGPGELFVHRQACAGSAGQHSAARPVPDTHTCRQLSDCSAAGDPRSCPWVLCVSNRLLALRGGSQKGGGGSGPMHGGSQAPLATAVGGEKPTLAEKDAEALVAYARLVGKVRGSDSVGAAGDALRRALGLNPANMDAATAYARVLHLEGHVTDALHMYRRALLGREPQTEHVATVHMDGGIKRVFHPNDGNMSVLVDHLITQPMHSADALAGFAGLLLSHPTLALQALQTAVTSAAVDPHRITSDKQQRSPGRGKRRNRGGTKFEQEFVLAAGRSILFRAIALAPSSPACADGMRDLVFAALQHSEDNTAATLVHSVSASDTPEPENTATQPRESTMLLQCLQEQELRVKTSSQQHARAVARLHSIQKQRQMPLQHDVKQTNKQTCLALRHLCLCTHTECSSSRTCSHFSTPPSKATPSSPRARVFAAASAALATATSASPTYLLSPSSTPEQPAAAAAISATAAAPPQTEKDALIDLANAECDMRVAERLAQMQVDLTQRRLAAETHAAACLRWSYGELQLRMHLVHAAEASFDVALNILPGFRPAMLRKAQLMCDKPPTALFLSTTNTTNPNKRQKISAPTAHPHAMHAGTQGGAHGSAWIHATEARVWHAHVAHLSSLCRASLLPPSVSDPKEDAGAGKMCELQHVGCVQSALNLALDAYSLWPTLTDPSTAFSLAAQRLRSRTQQRAESQAHIATHATEEEARCGSVCRRAVAGGSRGWELAEMAHVMMTALPPRRRCISSQNTAPNTTTSTNSHNNNINDSADTTTVGSSSSTPHSNTLRQVHAILRKAMAMEPQDATVLSACARLCWVRRHVAEAAHLLRAAAARDVRVLQPIWAREAYARGMAALVAGAVARDVPTGAHGAESRSKLRQKLLFKLPPHVMCTLPQYHGVSKVVARNSEPVASTQPNASFQSPPCTWAVIPDNVTQQARRVAAVVAAVASLGDEAGDEGDENVTDAGLAISHVGDHMRGIFMNVSGGREQTNLSSLDTEGETLNENVIKPCAEEVIAEDSMASEQERIWAQMTKEELLMLRQNLTQQLELLVQEEKDGRQPTHTTGESMEARESKLQNASYAMASGDARREEKDEDDDKDEAEDQEEEEEEEREREKVSLEEGPYAPAHSGEKLGQDELIGRCGDDQQITPFGAGEEGFEVKEWNVGAENILAGNNCDTQLNTGDTHSNGGGGGFGGFTGGAPTLQPLPERLQPIVSGTPGQGTAVIKRSLGVSPFLTHLPRLISEVAKANDELEAMIANATNKTAALDAINMEVIDHSSDDVIEMDLQRFEAGDARLAKAHQLEKEVLANPNRILDDEVRDTFRLAPLATAELSLPPAAPGAAPSKTPALRFTADTHSSQPREDNGGARMHTADAHSERSESDGGESGGGGGAGGGGGGEGEVIGAI